MNIFFFCLAAVVILCSKVNAEHEGIKTVVNRENDVLNGTCGEHLTWTLNNGTLTISGTGEMKDYNSGASMPWYNERSSITNIIIEDGVTSIESYAFYDSQNLRSITIPNSVNYIADDVFWLCTSLTEITLPNNITTISKYLFYQCYKLNNVIIPDNVTSIEHNAFGNCKSLTNIVIPDSVTSIGTYAFDGCSELKSIVLPKQLKTIPQQLFNGCTKLINVTIPDCVTFIDSNAFNGCSSLTSITIPENVPSIETNAFNGCESLSSVFYLGSHNISNNIFLACDKLKNICVSSDYKSDTFGGKNVTSNTETCQTFRNMLNQCYKPEEEQTTGYISKHVCTDLPDVTRKCEDGKCVIDKKPSDKPWLVIINLKEETIRMDEVNITEINEILKNNPKTNTIEVRIGWESDEHGYAIRVILYLKDEDTMKIVYQVFDEMLSEKEKCEYGFVKRIKSIQQIPVEQIVSGTKSIHNSIIVMLSFLIIFVLSL